MEASQSREEFRYEHICITLTPRHTVVETRLQRFYLYPKQSYYNKRHKTIRAMIRLGEITDLDTLARWCGTNIEWRGTDASLEALSRPIAPKEVKREKGKE